MDPELVDLPVSRHITGLAVRTSNARERDPATAMLPELWARFTAATPEHAASSDQPELPVYSVYTDYESDVNGAYTVILGREDGSRSPTDQSVTIPAMRYLVFSSTGEMPAAVVAGWQQVWTYFSRPDAPARAYTTDYEYYDPAELSTVRIHIAI